MKSFSSIVMVCALFMCIVSGKLSAGNILKKVTLVDAAVKKAKPFASKITTTRPKGDCGCNDNILKDPSFEDSNPFSSWTKSGNWTTDRNYAVCGDDAAVLGNAGYMYQDFQVVPGTLVNFSIWGGYHHFKSQMFKLSFLDIDKKEISRDSIYVDWNVDDAAANAVILKKYTFNQATAPEGTVYVRAEAKAKDGDWFKVDGGCLTITAPPVCITCTDNKLANSSFENGSDSWTKTGNWSSSTTYKACGSKGYVLEGAGNIHQEVKVIAGSTVNLFIYGGYHEQKDQTFYLLFFGPESSTPLMTQSVEVEWDVDEAANGQPVLKQYHLSGVAPAGTSYVSVVASSVKGGNWFKVDAACLTVTEPVCETCVNNKLDNPGFEEPAGSPLTGWTKTSGSGTFTASNNYVICGTYSGKITDKAAVAQTKTIAAGNMVTWTMYGGYKGDAGTKTFKIKFYNGNTELTASTFTVVIDKSVTAAPVGLKMYTMTKQAPATTTSVVIEISSSTGELYFDLGCLTIKADTPLPVTLTDFNIRKEGTSAALAWKTTAETNSQSFEVQHSITGKEWAVIGSVDAQGESSTIRSYSFTHTSPLNGNNLYRLKMIDKDETFAYSRIVSENFKTEESALLYPNPSSDFMKLRNGKEKLSSIQIYDIRGIKVKDFVPKEGVDVDISSLSSGSYIVTFKQNNGLIIKQKIEVLR